MRLFQNSGLYPAYLPRLARIRKGIGSYDEMIKKFLDDRYGAAHFLEPILNRDPGVFFANGDDLDAQRLWAKERGMPGSPSLDDILLAQIEHHRSEVFYNLDPIRYGSVFIRRLPGGVRRKIAWLAAPTGNIDLSAYDRVVCNFPSIRKDFETRGWKVAEFYPAHDPVMDGYSDRSARDVDIIFVGGYSRHHRRRALILEAVARLADDYRVVMCLNHSRLTRFSESAIGRVLPLREHRRPDAIRRVSAKPVFGRGLYEALAGSKIVLNGAIDMAGHERGNMRCFEALGCGATLLSDAGVYPDGFRDAETIVTYDSAQACVAKVVELLENEKFRQSVADAGRRMVSNRYSKKRQWEAFVALVG